MLLRFLGEDDRAERLEGAVASTLAAGVVTADLASEGSSVLGTRAFTESVISRLGMTASVA
jgi:isocitrate dehydrogenase